MVLLGWSSKGIGDALDVELQMVLLCCSSRGIGDALDIENVDGLTWMVLDVHGGCPWCRL
jgi:hypothetical protein